MREFTKAAISYGWASTCFQAQQLMNVLAIDPETQNSVATSAFNAVAESTAAQLGPTLRSTYRAGDAMQRGMVNMMFGVAGNWVPACGGRRDGKPTPHSSSEHGLARPSWRQSRIAEKDSRRPDLLPSGDLAGASAPGWGPMP